MTDLEMTVLCAEAMGWDRSREENGRLVVWGSAKQQRLAGICRCPNYDPLHKDAQAMALVKQHALEIMTPPERAWRVWQRAAPDFVTDSASLNRAIVECVAKMQQAKK